jgi:hypothetical protein
MITRATAKTTPNQQLLSALVKRVQELAAAQPLYQRLRDERGNRFYLFEGPSARPLPSVTSVLSMIAKPALTAWTRNTALEAMRDALIRHAGSPVTSALLEQTLQEAKQQPRMLAERASQYGLRGHEAFGRVLTGHRDGPEPDTELEKTVTSFEEWWGKSGYTLASAELVVRSERYGYAGQCDAIAVRVNERATATSGSSLEKAVTLAVLDWKTTSAIYSEYALQAAAYAKALEEMSENQLVVDEAWVIRFGRAGTVPSFEARQVRDLRTAFLCFRAALFLFNELSEELYAAC